MELSIIDRFTHTIKRGKKIEKTLIQPDFFEKEISKYDSKGNLTEEIHYDKTGNIIEKGMR